MAQKTPYPENSAAMVECPDPNTADEKDTVGAQPESFASSNVYQAADCKLLDAIPENERMHVVFEDIQAWVPAAPTAPSLMQKLKAWAARAFKPQSARPEASKKQILFNISSSCAPGELFALMGPSGSGKTSLLSILGARAPKTITFSGRVLFNGAAMSNRVRRRLGFVLQDDLLHEALTVHETLRYIALLCLPPTMSIEEKGVHAERVMRVLGIERQRDTLVGGRMHKGISGGERKRVSVAAELLMNPSVLFLDEPTSGLDAATALQLVDTLRQLASGGRTVITTIHQPSSRLYAAMDTLLLLARGRVVYFGRASLADRWFSHLGYPNPENSNIADFVLDLATNTVPLPSFHNEAHSSPPHQPPGLACPATGSLDTVDYLTAAADAFLKRHRRHGFVDLQQLQDFAHAGGSPLARPLESLASSGRASAVDEAELQGAGGVARLRSDEGRNMKRLETLSSHKFGASWWLQFCVLLERSIRARRLETVNVEMCIQTLVLGMLAGCFFFQSGQGSNINDLAEFTGVMFFLPQYPTIRTMIVAVFTFPTEYAILRKERASGMYRLSAYYLARSAADLPLIMTLPTIFFNELYWMGGFSRSAAAYFYSYFALFLMVITGHSAGLCIGAWLMDAKRAQTTSMVFTWFLLMVGGFLVRHMPGWISWSKFLAFYYWGFSLMNKIQLPALDVTGCVDGNGAERHCTLHDLQVFFRAPRSLSQGKALEIAMLILFFLLFRALTYIALRKSIAS